MLATRTRKVCEIQRIFDTYLAAAEQANGWRNRRLAA